MDNTIRTLWAWGSLYAIRLVAAVVIFVVGRWLAGQVTRLLARLLERQKVEVTLIRFLESISYYVLLVAVTLAAVDQLGVNTASLLAVLGAAGLAVGLALKDSLANFSAGVMLILFRPFRVGDFVVAGGVSGTVREIAIFNTVLATPDNQKVIVPNGSIMGNVITNVTANDTRRIDLVVGIAYEDDIGRAKDVLRAIVDEEPRILAEPAPVIAVSELGDNSVNLVVRPWVKTAEYWAIRFDLTERIKQAFDREGLHIPFPQRDVHLYMEQNVEKPVVGGQ